MKRLLFLAAIGLIAAPALASPDIMPVRGEKLATYDLATGQLTPGPLERYGDPIWGATTRSNYYFIQMNDGPGTTTLDWGDIVDVACTPGIGGLSFSYATHSVLLPNRLDIVMLFFADDNGFNTTTRSFMAGYQIVNLPTADPGMTWNGWTVWVDLGAAGMPFTICGSDLDGDGLQDFSYTYWFTNYVVNNPQYPDHYVGPVIAGDPNLIPPEGPGMENVFDYFADPNLQTYWGSYWFGGVPFAQFYLELFEATNVPSLYCPSEGAHGWYCTADIEPWPSHDCIVNLADLAKLLANYPTAAPDATHDMGDVEPEDGNGNWDPWDGDQDVDLGDLAQLLAMYLDDCN